MTVYFIQVLTILFFALLLNQKIKVEKRILFYVFLFSLSLVMGFRSLQVGTDTPNYMYVFKDVAQVDLLKLHLHDIYKEELPFAYLMKFCSYIINHYFFFQVVVSFLYCFGFLRLLYRFSSDFLFSSIIYMSCGLYLGSFNITRQMFVIMLLLWCWYYLIKSKYIKSVFFFLLAITTHFTAISFCIAILCYFVARRWPVLIQFLPFLVFPLIFSFDILFPYMSIIFEDQYFNYLDNHKGSQTAGGVVYLWGIVSIISLWCIYIRKNKMSFLPRLYGFFALIYVAANIVGLQFNYFERIGLYFAPFVIFLYEAVAESFKNKKIGILFKNGVATFYIIYYFLSCMSDQYIYKSFL